MPNLGDPAVEELDAQRELTDRERANLALMERWRELYNGDDMAAFVREAYHPDFRLINYDGVSWTGNTRHRHNKLDSPEMLVRAEEHVKRHAPGRRIRFNRLIAADNVVTVEASLLDVDDPDFELAWCGVYTFQDGLIISDHSYLNHRDWPGVVAMLGR